MKQRILYHMRRLFKPKIINNFGIKIKIDKNVFPKSVIDSFYRGTYEQVEYNIIKKTLDKDDTLLELGTGIGFNFIHCCKIINNIGKCHTFEANPQLIPIISENLELNNIKAKINNIILAERDGYTKFYLEKYFWSSSTSNQNSHYEEHLIKTEKFQKALNTINPSYLLIDIEGGEADLFNGIDLVAVKKICIEIHSEKIGKEKVNSMLKILLNYGFILDFEISRDRVLYLFRD